MNTKKFPGHLTDNLRDYLKEVQHIGFTTSFPLKKKLESKTYVENVRGHDIEITVNLARLCFGAKEEYDVLGIVTNVIDSKKRSLYAGFGSHAYVDEAKAMETAVVRFCLENDLMICQKINSWPFAKAIVQSNHFES